ncbi:hypothetical protein EQH57_0502 [Dictyocoela roeselum]|nr:hypothetical protein EQH57_0502 [Dictyocoela roeselum]
MGSSLKNGSLDIGSDSSQSSDNDSGIKKAGTGVFDSPYMEKCMSLNALSFEELKRVVLKRGDIAPAVYRSNLDVLVGNYVMMRCKDSSVLCKITSIREGSEVYSLTGGNRFYKTNLVVNLKCGDKVFPDIKLIYLSNSDIDMDAYNRHLKDNLIPSARYIKKYIETKRELTRSLSEKELTETINKRKKFYPEKLSRAKQKIELIISKNKLIESRKFADAEEIQKKIDRMNEEDNNEEKDIWFKLSVRNSKMNRENGLRAQNTESEVADRKADALNPFKRKKHRFFND